MKKMVSLLVVLFVLSVFTAGAAMAQAKPIEWKMISTWTPAINLIEGDKNFVKLVNELSGGRFKITGVSGKGTTVSVTIPLAKTAPAPAPKTTPTRTRIPAPNSRASRK